MRQVVRRLIRHFTAPNIPGSIHIEISGVCNFSCEYCVLRDHPTDERVMSDETFESLAESISAASSIALSGLAEPLMNRRFPTLLARTRELAPHARISVDSNASLLTREIAEAMVDSRLDSFTFSLDGVDETTVDAIRVGGSLHTLVENVRMLNEVKRERGSKLPVLSATMVLQRRVADQLPAVVGLAADLGVRNLSVNGLAPYDEAMVAEAMWADPESSLEVLETPLREAQRIARARGVSLRLPSLAPLAPYCPQVARPIVLADGTVVPCSVLAYPRDGFLRIDEGGSIETGAYPAKRVSFGNVRERPLAEIWMDDEYRGFRGIVAEGAFPHECSACLMKHNIICPNEPFGVDDLLDTRSA